MSIEKDFHQSPEQAPPIDATFENPRLRARRLGPRVHVPGGLLDELDKTQALLRCFVTGYLEAEERATRVERLAKRLDDQLPEDDSQAAFWRSVGHELRDELKPLAGLFGREAPDGLEEAVQKFDAALTTISAEIRGNLRPRQDPSWSVLTDRAYDAIQDMQTAILAAAEESQRKTRLLLDDLTSSVEALLSTYVIIEDEAEKPISAPKGDGAGQDAGYEIHQEKGAQEPVRRKTFQ
jgi:hypothetical protein